MVPIDCIFIICGRDLMHSHIFVSNHPLRDAEVTEIILLTPQQSPSHNASGLCFTAFPPSGISRPNTGDI